MERRLFSLSALFGRPADKDPARSMITIAGDSEVLIENCRRMIECSDIKCSVISAGYLVEVWGSGLTASSYAGGSAGISGRIQSVTIERRARCERDGEKEGGGA